MIPTDLTISLASWALDLERQRAAISAMNIANSNTTGIRQSGNFEKMVNNMSVAVASNERSQIELMLKTKVRTDSIFSNAGSLALDEEVLTMSQAQGRFKVIAEALSKKYGLMALAAKGK